LSLTLRKLSRGAIRQLVEAIERNPQAEPWEIEVENILLDGVGASHLYETGSALLLADDEGQIVGAALHYSDDGLPGAQYVATVLVDHRYRRLGYGRSLLQAFVTDAIDRSGRSYAVWIVHPENTVMLRISRELGEELGVDSVSGSVQFVYP
jgi:ribosomal protein S18 acetylase RimI-like enzyme